MKDDAVYGGLREDGRPVPRRQSMADIPVVWPFFLSFFLYKCRVRYPDRPLDRPLAIWETNHQVFLIIFICGIPHFRGLLNEDSRLNESKQAQYACSTS